MYLCYVCYIVSSLVSTWPTDSGSKMGGWNGDNERANRSYKFGENENLFIVTKVNIMARPKRDITDKRNFNCEI